MASVHAHPNAIPHDLFTQEVPPSPTLTNPEMILPYQPHLESSTLPQASSPILHTSPPPIRPDSAVSLGSSAVALEPAVELGTVTTTRMSPRAVPPIDTSYYGYEHGAPLSDIGEEETPRSRKSRRTQSPTTSDPPSPTPVGPAAQAMRRLSTQSASSNGSEFGDWETFDSSRIMNSRLAQDVAKVPDEEVDDLESKRNSLVAHNPDDEMARLNERAERILDHARKRLTHMEDNLSKARHSILASPRSSPNMNELHQPAGGLYRSISLAGAAQRKARPVQLVGRNNTVAHARGGSDTTAGNSGLKCLSMIPEVRSASALEYGRRQDSPRQYQASPTTTRLGGYSPASARSFNSPLRVLQEEDISSSTTKTSPGATQPRGLGINTLASVSRENVSRVVNSSPPTLGRSSSASSNRSTKQIREQMSNLEAKISDLKEKAQADSVRRRSMQSIRTPSPFASGQTPEQWYTSAPEYKEAGSPINTNAGTGWSPTQQKRPLGIQITPSTPQPKTFLNVNHPHLKDLSYVSETKTDKNTPNLHKSVKFPVSPLEETDSVIQDSVYEDAPQRFDDDEPIAASEEEQIYLNEVLEESLQDLEPEVPDIPEHLLPSDSSAGRHEDRLDAFDYENMFLHSALGNYTGQRPRSETPSESDRSSVSTTRADRNTPTGEDNQGDVKDAVSEAAAESAAQTPVQAQFPAPKTLLPSPGPLEPPSRPWLRNHRSDSVNSISTVATFETATEGGEHGEDIEDELPSEILSWGNGGAMGFPQPPTSPNREQVPTAWPTPPLSGRAGHSRIRSPPAPPLQETKFLKQNGMTTPIASPISSHATTPRAISSNGTKPYPAESGPAAGAVDHPANTQILMESLTKLADPDFRLGSVVFGDVDKDLVLDLLRAVGSVCNEILKAETRQQVRDVKVLRRRLDEARKLLEGRGEDEQRARCQDV